MEESFCHLHVHNEYSLLDGIGTAEAYAEKAKELGFNYLALTNHGNIDGCIRFQNACKAQDLTPILGFEGYIVPDIKEHVRGEKRNHIIILARNETGWINICKMLTIANLEGHFYRPRISPDILLAHSEGLVVSTACASTFLTQDWGINLLEGLIDRSVKTYLEVMPLMLEEQKKVNNLCVALSKKYELPVIATNDCHYINKEDSRLQEVLLAMQSGKKWKDPTRWKFDIDDLYLKSREQMECDFKRQGVLSASFYNAALDNTLEIAELCKDFAIPQRQVDLPLPSNIRGENPELYLKKLCKKALIERIKSNPVKAQRYGEYLDRYLEEIETIIRQGFCVYFLIVWELINWCKTHNIMVGPGRGSCGGSLVCYLLNITEVDPIEHGLIFARFISPARIDLPDIDMDFEDIKRGEVRKHLEDVYGVDNVAGVSTFSSMKGRGALRDVSRVFDVPLFDVNKASACIVVRSGGDFRSDFTIDDAFSTFEDGINFKKKYPEVTDTAIALEGQVKGKGQHAAAMIICKESLKDGIRGNLMLSKDGKTLVNWDKHDVEHVGLMKLDVLGLNALTILNETKRLIKQRKGIDVVFSEIPIDDPECYKNFSAGNNIGCFQVGSLGLRRLCVQLGVENFRMLVHATSLHRPGTLRSGMVEEFIKRKHGEIEWDYPHPALEKITKDTLGIILYQEQVMMFMYDLGGLGWKTADTVRKVISKSQGAEQFMKFKGLFVEGCLERKTLDKATAEALWDELASFGSYGFNLSHAVEYSYITYWDMWLKVHYPEEFICSNLTFGPEDKKEEILEEAYRMGMNIALPKVGQSHATNWAVNNNTLYMPFCSIKGIGDVMAKQCEDFSRTGFFGKKKEISGKAKVLLEQIGAFDLDKKFTEDEIDELSQYFSVPIVRDPSRKYKKVMKYIGENLKISQLGDIDWTQKATDKTKYYFGRMTEIRFGYSDKLQKLSAKQQINSGDNLGGVYGNMKDDTDFVMVVFNGEVYLRKKEEIEHCSDKFLLVKTKRSRNNILCSEVWFDDEILSGNLGKFPVGFKNRPDYSEKECGYSPERCDCEKCSYKGNCVGFTQGLTNAMIVNEWAYRDDFGRVTASVLSGKVGQYFWDCLGFNRKLFHVTCAVKGLPVKGTSPGVKDSKLCYERWLDKEISWVKPYVILAMGNQAVHYFKGQTSGITELSGTTEWNDKVNAWVCYCISPVSAYFHKDENESVFREGLDNFVDKYISLGRGYED